MFVQNNYDYILKVIFKNNVLCLFGDLVSPWQHLASKSTKFGLRRTIKYVYTKNDKCSSDVYYIFLNSTQPLLQVQVLNVYLNLKHQWDSTQAEA